MKAAKALFLADGYERTTMRRIAARVQVTPTTLYMHFPDKQALLREISNESFGLLEQALRDAMASDLPPLEAFSRMLDVYVDFGLTHPREYRFLLMTEVSDWVPPERSPQGALIPGDDVGMRALAFLEQQITHLMDAGVIRRDSSSAVAETVWAAAHGLVSLLITFPDFPWSERRSLIDTTRRNILEGIRASSAGDNARSKPRY